MLRITRYLLLDLLKNGAVIAFSVLLFLVSFGLFLIEPFPEKALLGLMNILILVIPLIAIIFTTTYYYNAYEFITLLAAQPVKRVHILLSIYLSIGAVLFLFLAAGAGIPLLIFHPHIQSLFLFGGSLLLMLVFVSLALITVMIARDKTRGMGLALVIWLFFTLIFDGIMLIIMYNMADYPLEKMAIVFSMFNPVDLCRMMIVMQTDAAALMGFSGAVFQNYFGTAQGTVISTGVLVLWIVLPLYLAVRQFRRRDI